MPLRLIAPGTKSCRCTESRMSTQRNGNRRHNLRSRTHTSSRPESPLTNAWKPATQIGAGMIRPLTSH